MNIKKITTMLSNIDWIGIMTYCIDIYGVGWIALIILIIVNNYLKFDFYGSKMLLIFYSLLFVGLILNILVSWRAILMIKKCLNGSRPNN